MNHVDKVINDDFIKIIGVNPTLLATFRGLPQSQREKVLREWNRLIWEMIMAPVGDEQ